MPLYEYACSHCTNKVEKLKKIEERDKVQECPQCKKGFLNRVVSQTGGFSIEASKIYV